MNTGQSSGKETATNFNFSHHFKYLDVDIGPSFRLIGEATQLLSLTSDTWSESNHLGPYPMTGTVVKKKRFEGLIQFQEPLRQALVCIQAAFPNRFATSAQSEILKGLNTPDLSHFYLTTDGSDVGDGPTGLHDRPVLMTVEQLSDDQVEWKNQFPAQDVKIAAWVNSADPLACQQIYWLLAAATSENQTFDLAQMTIPGALQTTLKDSPSKKWMCADRVKMFQAFEKDSAEIIEAEKALVTTDGCTVSLMIEGPTHLNVESAFEAAMRHLKNTERHLVMVNYLGGPKPRLQCVFLTPMRLPLKELQCSALKGFVLLRDIKEPVKLAKSMLAG